MKKLLSVLLLVMSVLALNAQDTKTPSSTESKKVPTDANAPSMSTSTLKVADLPKTVTDNITKDYPGYMIKEAIKTTDASGNYKVVIAKGTSTETLLYDKNGKFLKKDATKKETTKKSESGAQEMPKK